MYLWPLLDSAHKHTLPITCYMNYKRYSSRKAYRKLPVGRMESNWEKPLREPLVAPTCNSHMGISLDPSPIFLHECCNFPKLSGTTIKYTRFNKSVLQARFSVLPIFFTKESGSWVNAVVYLPVVGQKTLLDCGSGLKTSALVLL